MQDREWTLSKDLVTSDSLLDGLTFDDLILAVHAELNRIMATRRQDMMFLLEKNMDTIMAEARKGRA